MPVNARERLHLAAIAAILADDYGRAKALLGTLLQQEPRDVLALQVAHNLDYLTGDVARMGDRVAGVLPAWSTDMPGYHAVLAMYAFALEEAGDYAGADLEFSTDTSPAGTYNRGNALAHQGKYDEAIAAYTATLRANPRDEDAAFNKALLEKLRDRKQAGENDSNESQRNREEAESGQPREQNSSGNPNQEASQSGEQQANKRPETKQQKSDQDQKQPNDEEKQQTAEREAPRDEQRDALEQWLRRVPDDPSGLLRRKFQFETNERLRSGVPDPRDQERIW